MTFQLSRPTLSVAFSLLALFCGLGWLLVGRYLPEHQSFSTFVVLMPAMLIAAMAGYVLGATSKVTRKSIVGYLISASILATFLIIFMLPAFFV